VPAGRDPAPTPWRERIWQSCFLYASTHGHTAKIDSRIADGLRSEAHAVDWVKGVCRVTATSRGKRSKAGFEVPVWCVTTFRDGLAVRVETYDDPEQALEAAGLSG
jgi:hypothetical protein